jgi:hypothetical protein
MKDGKIVGAESRALDREGAAAAELDAGNPAVPVRHQGVLVQPQPITDRL